MVIIDTDVLLLAFAFHRDVRQTQNNAFLNSIQQTNAAITIYNLMELLGQLSYNLSAERLLTWKSWLVDAYQLTIIWPVDPDDPVNAISFRNEVYERPIERMINHRAAFMDALILNLAERTPDVEYLITWNARHFKDKSSLLVLTPQEYLVKMGA